MQADMRTVEQLESELAKHEKLAHERLAGELAVHRRLAAAELNARLGWERYEAANKSHMAAINALAEANAELWKLKNGK